MALASASGSGTSSAGRAPGQPLRASPATRTALRAGFWRTRLRTGPRWTVTCPWSGGGWTTRRPSAWGAPLGRSATRASW
eukprot:2878585-Alexandrium_andersonii.AAC.1